jgi:hypothetical protein
MNKEEFISRAETIVMQIEDALTWGNYSDCVNDLYCALSDFSILIQSQVDWPDEEEE